MRILWAFFILGLGALACNPPSARDLEFSGARAYSLVEEQLAFGPLIPGSEASREAGDWILAQLGEAGWDTYQQAFSYQGIGLRNLGARRGLSEGDLILFGTHYDTRPIADNDPLGQELPVPGANDGASGVAVLLELARVIPPDLPGCKLELAFFDAEDSGGLEGWDWILGSSYYVENRATDPSAVIIVDMVGDRDLEIFLEWNSDVDLADSIWDAAALLGFGGFVPELNHSLIDDHTPFVAAGIPAALIIDFDYPYWHTPEDTLDKISADSLEQVGLTLTHWVTQRCQ